MRYKLYAVDGLLDAAMLLAGHCLLVSLQVVRYKQKGEVFGALKYSTARPRLSGIDMQIVTSFGMHDLNEEEKLDNTKKTPQ